LIVIKDNQVSVILFLEDSFVLNIELLLHLFHLEFQSLVGFNQNFQIEVVIYLFRPFLDCILVKSVFFGFATHAQKFERSGLEIQENPGAS